MSDQTAFARFTQAEWETARAMFAGADSTVEGVALRNIFDQPFEPSPKVIGDAVDLIKPWRDVRVHVGKVASPVTITITGPQASGKTLIATAIEQTLRTNGMTPRMIRADGDRKRYKLTAEREGVSPVVFIEDVQ